MRFNNYVRDLTVFPKHIVSQLVGHLLGDGALVMSNTSTTPYFVFTQTLKRFDYIWSVFSRFCHYCSQYPSLTISRKKYPFMRFHTRSYPIMLTLDNLFYSIVNGKRTKTISPNLLFYLDDVALAYWAMDDGAKARSGFYFHTKAYTFNEAYLLAGILHYNFNLNCSVQNHKNTPVINIKAESMSRFKSLVLPHFHPSMTYKLI
jgi:LAGLIDADG DNA endonuclease family